MSLLRLIAFLCIAAPLAAEPFDLDATDIATGKALYREVCHSCHGTLALGGNAPDIQGSILYDVESAISGLDMMPEIHLTDEQAALIATYLMSLAPDQAAKRLQIRGK